LLDASGVRFQARAGGIVQDVGEVADVALRLQLVEIERGQRCGQREKRQ